MYWGGKSVGAPSCTRKKGTTATSCIITNVMDAL